ncbi:MAG: VOC family protein [Gammaproteobacteria bacterium]|nr:VOC family protein [Gammaproteobacteria bacterium]
MSFHLSLPVRSLEETRTFFVTGLGATLEHEDPAGYINIDFHGAKLTFHERPDMAEPEATMHFGLNLAVDDFMALAARVESAMPEAIQVPARVVDAGTDRERHKLFVKSPEGYLIELKGMQGA